MKRTGKHLFGKLKKRRRERMIEFKWSKVDKKNNNTPIIKDVEIDELAEMLLKDYKPQLLKEPTPINHLHFLESYLGANIEFMDIYYEKKPIWGATAFNDEEYLKVFDRENCRTGYRELRSRTIVIDNYVMKEGKEGLGLFTGLHEGGHLWLHPGVYVEPEQVRGMKLPLSQRYRVPPEFCRNSKTIRETQMDKGAILSPRVSFLCLSIVTFPCPLPSKFEGVKLPLSQRYRVRPEFCRNSKTIERPKWTREQS
jgi:hypothetical protein